MLTALALAAACGGNGAELERLRREGVRVGFALEPPYAMVDSLGRPDGEAPAVLRQVLARLELTEAQWYPLEFHELIPALRAGRIDVVAAGMFVTRERALQVRFTRPTACVRPVLLARAVAGPLTLATCAGCRIAVLEGSVEQEALKGTAHPIAVVSVPDLAAAVHALLAGDVTAFAISAPTARSVVRTTPALRILADALPEPISRRALGCAAFALRPQDAEVADAFDGALASFLGTPAHLALARAYGFEPSELPCAGRARPSGREWCGW